MNRFYVGQEVVCIDDNVKNNFGVKPLKKGTTYIIRAIRLGHCKQVIVDVGIESQCDLYKCNVCEKRIAQPYPEWFFMASRFAPIEEIPKSHEELVYKLIDEQIHCERYEPVEL